MKKIVCYMLCFVLACVHMGTMRVLADDEMDPTGIFELTAESGNYNVGDVIELKIYSHDYPISWWETYIEYDETVFQAFDESTMIFNDKSESGEVITYGSVYQADSDQYNGITCSRLVIDEQFAKCFVMSQDGYIASMYFVVKGNFSETTINFWNNYVVTENYNERVFENISCTIHNSEESNSEINTEGTDGDVIFSVAKVEAVSGEVAKLPLNITSNNGFNALGITISYDNTICSYNEISIADEYKDKIDLQSVYEVPGEGKIKASFIAAEDIENIGNFATLSFMVKGEAAIGSTCDVDVTIEQITNKVETDITGVVTGGRINVVEEEEDKPTGGGSGNQEDDEDEPLYTQGDVNEDGDVDLTDAVYILLNYNEEKILSRVQELAADVTGDGIINLTDALQILKYFNGEISTFE